MKTAIVSIFICGGKPKLTAIACSANAGACGNAASLACEKPLVGDKVGRTCGRPICEQHAEVRNGLKLCPPHAKRAT